ncbi:MAG: ATP-binding protein [Candidatus Magasanikbacteria bacterium]
MVFSELKRGTSIGVEKKEKKESDLLAQKYIESLDVINEFVLKKEITFSIEELFTLSRHIDSIFRAIDLIRKNQDLDKHRLHDLNNIGTGFVGFLALLKSDLAKGDYSAVSEDLELLSEYRSDWFRFYVALKDALLRQLFMSGQEYEMKYNFDLEVIKNVLDFFVEKEIVKLKQKNSGSNSYEGIEKRRLQIDVDWDVLYRQLEGKQIKGDIAVVGNTILNELRNSLKKNIEVAGENTEIDVDIFVEDNDLVIRVSDTGKGMEFRHLDPKDADCIFKKGSSSTGSSGLGLADLHIRLAQMGVEIVILSKRVGQDNFEYYSNGIGIPGKSITLHSHDEVEKMFNKDGENHFARKVKEKGHGTVISLYLPLAA